MTEFQLINTQVFLQNPESKTSKTSESVTEDKTQEKRASRSTPQNSAARFAKTQHVVSQVTEEEHETSTVALPDAPASSASLAVPLANALETLPQLPWQLRSLIRAASHDVALDVLVPGVLDVNRYVLAWGCAYLTGDRDEALRRLWPVYYIWQGGSK